MTPSFQEAPISQIPVLRFLQQLNGKIHVAMETLFLLTGRAGNSMRIAGNRVGQHRWEGFEDSQILRILACKACTMCELTLNRPATPLNDAHQGGCFMYDLRRKGGRP